MNLPRIHVAVGLLIRHTEVGAQILISRRHDDAVLGGFWEFPGGKMEPEETPVLCVQRELTEELDLQVRVIEQWESLEHQYDHAHVTLWPCVCELIDPAQQARDLAVAEHRWISPAELRSYRFPSANAPMLTRLIQSLKRAPR